MPSVTKTQIAIGKKIQKARKQLGQTQEEIAHSLRISRTHYGNIEQGVKSPSLELLTKIANKLGIPLKELF